MCVSARLLEVQGLRTHFFLEAGVVLAVDGISFDIEAGTTLGMMGESGSGKTATALSILRILPEPGRIVDGQILFHAENLLNKSEKEMQSIRGGKIAMTFQDPTISLDAVYTIGDQLVEVIRHHQSMGKDEAVKRALETLWLVGIPDPTERMNQYPHELSTGQRQRIALARSISCQPELLIADEPTTALDVTIQAQILDLLKRLKRELDMSLILISHDMGVIAEMADSVVILYAGHICEYGDVEVIFQDPKHPYTEALLKSAPRVDLKIKENLSSISGTVPDLINPPTGCRFHPRCQYATSRCKVDIPAMEKQKNGSCVACWRYGA